MHTMKDHGLRVVIRLKKHGLIDLRHDMCQCSNGLKDFDGLQCAAEMCIIGILFSNMAS